MQYWMLQLFLTSREKPPIIDATSPTRGTRRSYLETTFRGDITFEYRKKKYLYRTYWVEDGYVAAAIGREQKVTIKPNPDFREQEVSDWETANVFINLSGDADGQKVAMQKTPHILNPLEVFRALTDFINRRDVDTDWTIATNPVSQAQEFWTAVERNRGQITELDLIYAPPNIWGGKDATQDALKKLHAETNNDEVEVKIRNSDGKLDLDGKVIHESVDYVTKGGGKAVLKVGKRKVFDTDSAVVTESPSEDIEVEGAPKNLLKALIAKLFG